MNKYQLKMKTPSGLGTEYVYVESYKDNFERFLEEHNIKYKKYNYKTNQDKEIERLNKCYCERTDCGGRIKESRNYNSLFQENERLNNIINELEKHINSMCFGTIQEEEIIDNILNKLKELKENK